MGVKLRFDLNTMQIHVEGEAADIFKVAEKVREIAPMFEEVRLFPPGKMPETEQSERRGSDGGKGSGGVGGPGNGAGGGNPPLTGMRDFARSLPLDNQFIRIAAIAFYQRESGRPTFSAKEMGDWFGLCGFLKPQKMAVALSDTARRKEYIKNSGRDQWSLTTIGENAVRVLIEAKGS